MENIDGFFNKTFADLKLDNKIERSEREATWILNFATNNSKVLDLGCGRGRLAISLAQQGAEVVAIDNNEEYLNVARDRYDGSSITWKCIDILEYEFPYNHFDIIISAFSSFGYFSELENKELLTKCAKALKPDGVFILETTNRDGNDQLLTTSEVERRGTDSFVLKEYSFDPWTSRKKLKFTYIIGGSIVNEGLMDFRVYSLHELNQLFNACGLEIVSLSENMRGNDFDIHGPHLTVVGRKLA